jgi:hypothetical protein
LGRRSQRRKKERATQAVRSAEEEKGNAGDPAEGDDAKPELISHIATYYADGRVHSKNAENTGKQRCNNSQHTSPSSPDRKQQ